MTRVVLGRLSLPQSVRVAETRARVWQSWGHTSARQNTGPPSTDTRAKTSEWKSEGEKIKDECAPTNGLILAGQHVRPFPYTTRHSHQVWIVVCKVQPMYRRMLRAGSETTVVEVHSKYPRWI